MRLILFLFVAFQLHAEGFMTHTETIPGTQLPGARYVLNEGSIYFRQFFEYDSQQTLLHEVIDDGSSPMPTDMRGVSLRWIRSIDPRTKSAVIEEQHWDNEKEILSRRNLISEFSGEEVETHLARLPISGRYQTGEKTEHSQILPPLDPQLQTSPSYYVNGILNSVTDCLREANVLFTSLGNTANIIPAYSRSFGPLKDLFTVFLSKSFLSYNSHFVKMFRQRLIDDLANLPAEGKKIFIICFSRGVADVFHTIKDFTEEQREKLIILACGPVLLMPKEMGFKVVNVISKGDWPAQTCNEEHLVNPTSYETWADVIFLASNDHRPLIGDHFFESMTYQGWLREFGRPLYEAHCQ